MALFPAEVMDAAFQREEAEAERRQLNWDAIQEAAAAIVGACMERGKHYDRDTLRLIYAYTADIRYIIGELRRN